LAIVAAGDLMANTPLEFLVERSDVALDLLYVDTDLPLPDSLPDHDLVFVAVGESDHNRPLLEHIAQRAQTWDRPLLNAPQYIINLTRSGVSAMLRNAQGICMPDSARITRAKLQQMANKEVMVSEILAEGVFPIIVRPAGSHAGHGLEKINDVGGFDAYLRANPAEEFYVSRFVDYRSADGQFRKYRVILIEGHPYICHMGISDHWMIHYLNAGMAESADKRAEEARFMADFNVGFAARHAHAFKTIFERLKLDYVGLDCGETADGELLIFEADSDMIVHDMDPAELFPYKQPVMGKIFDAFHAMLLHAIKN
jgi:glutathione synthase/RimK-type ligase-like ATP-grasp enzyme